MNKNEILKEIDAHIQSYHEARRKSKYDDLSDLDILATQILAQFGSAIDRLSPSGSQYRRIVESISQQYGATSPVLVEKYLGILSALRADYASGYLNRIEALIHADVFSDFLDMASHLLAEKYKDPAAVIIGGVLEEHLRKLCSKNQIPIDQSGKARKADTLNAELARNGTLTLLDQKNITAWLDLRNKAAHGRYAEYSIQQVELLLQSVRDFITRIPA